MKNWWIRLGCFLTGYNYRIVTNSSEAAATMVKRVTSALVIICIVWAFVGYTFSGRYLKAGTFGAVVGAIILCVIVIQIERQIILAINPDRTLRIFRGVIAVLMAIIGSIIMDQIVFRDDVEKRKTQTLSNEVDRILPQKTRELKKQIAGLDTAIARKEAEKERIRSQPEYSIVATSQSVPVTLPGRRQADGSTTASRVVVRTLPSKERVRNSNYDHIPEIDKQIQGLTQQKHTKEHELLKIRPAVEAELRSKVGFLDELELMFGLLASSGVALFIWTIWFLFFLGIELFILISKGGEKGNDYDSTIRHQMQLQEKRLQLLSNT